MHVQQVRGSEGKEVDVHSSADLRRVLISKGADQSIIQRGGSDLMLAASISDIDACKEILSSGVSINDYDNDGWTALHYAALKGDHHVTQFLVEKGCDINLKTKKGQKALTIASSINNQTVVSYLIQQSRVQILEKAKVEQQEFRDRRRIRSYFKNKH